jgi:nucleoside-diphosphate-sugar epimerase
MKKILITGASGFVGSHLLDGLVQNKKFEITGISRKIENLTKLETRGIKAIQADLCDYKSMESAMKGIDILINIAAEIRNEDQLENTNINGVENIAKAAEYNGVKKIIHLSSVGVVGAQYQSKIIIITEESKCRPQNNYEITKLRSEEILKQKYKGELIIMRPTNVFGENHPFNALLNLMTRVKNGKPLPCSSMAYVNYVYVKDLTDSIIELIDKKMQEQIFNVGSSMKLTDFFLLLRTKLETGNKVVKIPQTFFTILDLIGINKLQTVSNQAAYCDKKLKKYVSYQYDYDKGIDRVIKFYRNQNLL